MEVLEDVLKDLYNGKININEKFPSSDEYNILISDSRRILKKIEEKLNQEGKILLNNYIEKQSQIVSIECEEKFIEGYKMSSKLIISGIK